MFSLIYTLSFRVRCKPAFGKNVSIEAYEKHKYNVMTKAQKSNSAASQIYQLCKFLYLGYHFYCILMQYLLFKSPKDHTGLPDTRDCLSIISVTIVQNLCKVNSFQNLDWTLNVVIGLLCRS